MDPLGTSLIADAEVLVRATYENHWQKNKKPAPHVQPSMINNRELREKIGLSVWRRHKLGDSTLEGLNKHLASLNEAQPFRQAYALTGTQLRQISDPVLGRVISLINNTDTGHGRPPEPAHAAIFICDRTFNFDAAFEYAKTALYIDFRNAPLTA